MKNLNITMIQRISLVSAVVVLASLFAYLSYASADTIGPIDFENPPYTLGVIHGQNGWSASGSAGSGCATYDEGVSSSLGVSGFGSQSFRISNAVTSGCFGDQAFSASLANEAGETDAQASAFSGGTRQPYFEAEFAIAAATTTEQPGLFMSVSPDRGDGARMSYLGFADTAGGIDVTFYDVQGTSDPATFVPTVVATDLSRAVPHTVKFTMQFVDGPSNDVVQIYIDGNLVHTGTSWENYFRYDDESNPSLVNESRTVDSLLFRAGGTAAPGTAGMGYLIDNLSLTSGPVPVPPTVTVTIAKYIDGVHADATSAQSLAFPMQSCWTAVNIGNGCGNYDLDADGFNNPNPYEATTAQMSEGADYSTNEVTGGAVVGASCAGGQPYELAGYSWGDSMAAAEAMTPTTTSPALTDIMTDKYVIVWNETCPPPVPLDQACELDQTPVGYTRVEGTPGFDKVTLAPMTMFIGFGGNDKISGGNGDFIICAGPGTDTITLGNGTIHVDAGEGNNKITLGHGTGSITAGSGNNTIQTGNGARTMELGDGNNKVNTGGGDQTITAGAGNDKITTGSGNDTVNAGDGNNTVDTKGGTDTLTSGSGNDKLNGGAGTDTCDAGGGFNKLTSCP